MKRSQCPGKTGRTTTFLWNLENLEPQINRQEVRNQVPRPLLFICETRTVRMTWPLMGEGDQEEANLSVPASREEEKFIFFWSILFKIFHLSAIAGWIVPSKGCIQIPTLIPTNVILLGHRVFADVSWGCIGLERAPSKASSGEWGLETCRDRKDRRKAGWRQKQKLEWCSYKPREVMHCQ